MVRLLPRDVLRGLPTVAATDTDEARSTIAALLNEHTLIPQTRVPSLDMKLRSLQHGEIGFQLLDYGSPVGIASDGLEDFHLVQIPLSGRARMRVGGESVESSPGVASVPPLDRAFSMEWERGTPHLMIYVRRSALQAIALQMDGAAGGDTSSLGYSMKLGTHRGRAFLRAVVELHDDLIRADNGSPGFVRRLLTDTMLSRLLLAMDPRPAHADRPAPAAGHRVARSFDELLENHWTEQLTVPSMAEFLGVSVRTLQQAVRREYEATPTEMLRRTRLNRAREILLEQEPGGATVIAVAQRCGFSHPGRFASAYLEAFGELPSESLRR